MRGNKISYVILTPCHNEEQYIEFPLRSVIAQTLKPAMWMIVDDSSTDGTGSLIKQYASEYENIHYHYRTKPAGQAYFASNVYAIMEGYGEIGKLTGAPRNEGMGNGEKPNGPNDTHGHSSQGPRLLDPSSPDGAYRYIAILDADITLPPDYYESIIHRMEADPKLGIASGIYENLIDGKLVAVLNDRRSTPKAIMVFRRECFEQIGGFLPLKYGGEDTAACVMARMRGWKVWSFPDVKVIHHRPTGIGNAKSLLRARFHQGKCEYYLGNHPTFFLLKSIRRCLKENPFIIGGLMRIAGYLGACFSREKRILPDGFLDYIRREQLNRIFRLNKI